MKQLEGLAVSWLLQWFGFTMVHARGYLYFDPEYRFIGEKAKGNWTRWFNGDNPTIFDPNSPGGDVETLQHESRVYGHHCDWGVACPLPIGFEVDVSHYWRTTYPGSNMSASQRCTNLSPKALTTIGEFQCSNSAQLDRAWVRNLPKGCLEYCQISGQMYLGRNDPRFAQDILPNCYVCPDFAIRFFCLDSDKDCISKEDWLEMLKLLAGSVFG